MVVCVYARLVFIDRRCEQAQIYMKIMYDNQETIIDYKIITFRE